MRAYFSYAIAFLIVVALGVLMATGTLIQGGQGPGNGEKPVLALAGQDSGEGHEGESHATADGIDPAQTIAERNATTSEASGEARSVRARTYVARPMAIEVPLRGRTEAKSSVSVVAQTGGIVTEVGVTRGDAVAAGDVLCRLDPGARQAAVAQAEAALAQAQLNAQTNASLREKGVAAANTAAAVEAALKGAEAALDQARQELDRTEIKTEVAGIVQDPLASVGQMLGNGGVCASVVTLDPIVFVGSVPEARIGLARTDLAATLKTVSGDTAEGKVTFVSAVADAATRSFKVEIEFPNPGGRIKDGLTAEAVVKVGTAPAHLLPQSILTLDDKGTLGVRAVENDVVAFYPITIVNDTVDGVWVTGLPAKIDIITLGQEYVTAGQTVKATIETEDKPS